jgi:AraC family transcriptional regulator, regulatory protein of adaptative response / DNA-3-methyladenine glycosylase II
VRLELAYTPPFAADALVGFLAGRAIPGVEEVADGVYRRVLQIGARTGVVAVSHPTGADALQVELSDELVPVAGDVASGVRRVFDTDADAPAIDARLRDDPRLLPSVAARPGVRVAGAFDGFEIAVRAILGQQISVAAARTIAGRLSRRFGEPYDDAPGSLGVAFPRPAALAAAPANDLGMPVARGETLVGLARAVDEGRVDLAAGGDPERARAGLLALPGIGPWTASYVAMRAFGEADAFPASDLVLRQVLGGATPATTRRAEQLSAHWSPWRAYAVVRLWALAAELRAARGAA